MSSRGNTDSTSPPQSLQLRSFSTIQAASPAGESPSPAASVCGLVDCSSAYAPSLALPRLPVGEVLLLRRTQVVSVHREQMEVREVGQVQCLDVPGVLARHRLRDHAADVAPGDDVTVDAQLGQRPRR